MARISVSVPDEMKEQMDSLGNQVNWSEAARSAFQREISAATLPDDPGMDQVIERLRASKTHFDEEHLRQAREGGRRWGKTRATYGDLRAISKLSLTVGGDPYWRQFDRTVDLGEDARNSIWYHESPEEAPSNDYVEEFVEGAKDVWREVKDKI